MRIVSEVKGDKQIRNKGFLKIRDIGSWSLPELSFLQQIV